MVPPPGDSVVGEDGDAVAREQAGYVVGNSGEPMRLDGDEDDILLGKLRCMGEGADRGYGGGPALFLEIKAIIADRLEMRASPDDRYLANRDPRALAPRARSRASLRSTGKCAR